MHKQYHFQKNAHGLCAWDIDRLIGLSTSLPRRRVALQAIRELDEAYWFEHEVAPTCRAVVQHMSLIEEADLSHPVILSSDGRVMDGMHRVAEALLSGREHVEAVQFVCDPEPDYVSVAPEELPDE